MNLYQKLQWMIQMGVTETISDTPYNRFKMPQKTAPNKPSPSLATTPPTDCVVQQAVHISNQASSIDMLHQALLTFDSANLKKTAANTVFAKGNPKADIMIIGDIPEACDDLSGTPFCGEVGALLDRMMQAIQLDTDKTCYTTMLIPWRTPGGRKPTPAEIAYCLPFVKRHIDLIQPRYLLLFGALTTGALLGIDSLSRARGEWHLYQSETLSAPIHTLATFSPAYLIKNASHRKYVWEDLKRFRQKLNESGEA